MTWLTGAVLLPILGTYICPCDFFHSFHFRQLIQSCLQQSWRNIWMPLEGRMAHSVACQRAEELNMVFSCDDSTFWGLDLTNWGIVFQLLPFWMSLRDSVHLAIPALYLPTWGQASGSCCPHCSSTASAVSPSETSVHEHPSFQGWMAFGVLQVRHNEVSSV